MKHYPILKLSKLAMTVAAVMILLLSSCRQDDLYIASPESTLVNLSVSSSNSGVTTTGNDPASVISSLCILQFNADGNNFGTLRHVGMGTETSPGHYTATLMQSISDTDKYKIVILANIPGGYSAFLRMVGKRYAEVQQACLSQIYDGESVVPTFDDANPFPMFGIPGDGTPIIIEEGTALGNVSLVRAVARVDIGIGTKQPDNTWKKGSVKFTMNQIQIWKAGKQYAYLPVANNFTSMGGELTISKPSPVGNNETKVYDASTIKDGTYCSEKIYLPEADLLWGSVYDGDHTNRLAIIVGGYYNESSTETFYRVDFINDLSNDKMDILRNHVYQFTIKSVTDDGYATAELAYKSAPINIGFKLTLEAWQTGDVTNSVPSLIGYTISHGRLNGEELLWDDNANPKLSVPLRKELWYQSSSAGREYDYNEFYGESNNFYALMGSPGPRNGMLYHTVSDAFKQEGAYPALMVSGDDIIDTDGSISIAWKEDNTLKGFDICRAYQGYGYSDWRLPRLSELALIYLNKEKLEAMRGFTPFSGTYWCASEYLVSTSEADRKHSEYAWAINFDSTNPNNASHNEKATKLHIRCVRQVN